MALVVAVHPELVGHAAFVAACGCGPTTLNPTTGFHHVTVCGVPLRITSDLEYVVEQDLYIKRKLVDMESRKAMTAIAYRVRAAYSSTRRESQVGDRRLNIYRELREDPNAVIFLAKSRATGGKTPPPAMAISIVRYYVHAIGADILGLDKHPEFLELINNIELLPKCELNESLQGKFKKSDGEEEDETDTPDPAPCGVEETAIEKVVRERDSALDEVRKLSKKYKTSQERLMKMRSHETAPVEVDGIRTLTEKIEELSTRIQALENRGKE